VVVLAAVVLHSDLTLSMSSPSDSASSSSAAQLDQAELHLRKRLPPRLPRRDVDVYVTRKTSYPAQLQRCQRLLDRGEPHIFLHALGAALAQASNLALRLKKDNPELTVETFTASVALTDDFEPVRGQADSQQRHNSALHFKLSQQQRSAASL